VGWSGVEWRGVERSGEIAVEWSEWSGVEWSKWSGVGGEWQGG
jgi:hypothetical protein